MAVLLPNPKRSPKLMGRILFLKSKLRTQTIVASIFEQESRKIPPLWCESLRNLMTLFGKKYFPCITLLYFSHSAPYLTSEPGG